MLSLVCLLLSSIVVLSSAFSPSTGPRPRTGDAVAPAAPAAVVGRRADAAAKWRRRRLRRHIRYPLAAAASDDDDEYYDDGGEDDDEEVSSLPSDASAATRILGERLILAAATGCGATEKMVNVEWRGGRIVVTVDVYADGDYDYDDDDGEVYDFDVEADWDGDDDVAALADQESDDGELDPDEFSDVDDVDDPEEGSDEVKIVGGARRRPDLTLIARAINEAFACDAPDGPGYAIATVHEIEVTTPAFDGVLRGRRMFDSYRGFDVIVEHQEEDEKKKKKKKKKKDRGERTDDAKVDDDCEIDGEVAIAVATEEDGGLGKLKVTRGKLVGRDYGGGDGGGVTTINVRGRAVRIRNEDIASVSLPKAKREKGVR
jgi:hypothetical protein